MYSEAVEIDHRNGFAYYLKAITRIEFLMNFQDGLNDLNKVLQLKPDCGQSLSMRCKVTVVLFDYENAIKDFNKAILLDKNDFSAYNVRGSAKLKLGDYRGAIL